MASVYGGLVFDPYPPKFLSIPLKTILLNPLCTGDSSVIPMPLNPSEKGNFAPVKVHPVGVSQNSLTVRTDDSGLPVTVGSPNPDG